MWQWDTNPEVITPTGYGICGGEIYTVPCYSGSRTTSNLTSYLIYNNSLHSESSSSSTSQLWLGTRSLNSVSRSLGSLDTGRGLTVINETGVISSDTTILRFVGTDLYSGATINSNSDATITTDNCLDIDAGSSTEQIPLDTLNGGTSENHQRSFEGGDSIPC